MSTIAPPISTQEELDRAIATGKSAVYVHATWCPFCRVFKPVFAKVVQTLPNLNAVDLLIDDEENPIWERYEIQTIPTVLFFEDGVLKDRMDAAAGIGLNEKGVRARLASYAAA